MDGFVNMLMQLNMVGFVHPIQSMVKILIHQVLIGHCRKQKHPIGNAAVKTKTHTLRRFVYHHK